MYRTPYYRPRNKAELIEQIYRSGFRHDRRKLRNLPKRILWGMRADMIRWFEAREFSSTNNTSFRGI